MKAALDFWVRAHQDERNEPSGPRLSGFITLIALLACIAITLYGAFSGNKLVTETGIKLTSGLGLVVGALYGATQIRSGLSGLGGLFVARPANEMPGQMPGQTNLQQSVLPQAPIQLLSSQSLEPSTKPSKPCAATLDRWVDRVAKIVRARDLAGVVALKRERLQKIHKPLGKDLEERLALAMETKPWESRPKIDWRPI